MRSSHKRINANCYFQKRECLLNQLAEIDVQLGTLQREILDIERMEAENTKVHLDDLTIQVSRVNQ